MNEEIDYRISKLRNYMFKVINTITENRDYQINANFLSDKIDDYSLDKLPTKNVEPFVNGDLYCIESYSFRSRKSYSKDFIVNLKNMGFGELLEEAIENNNKKRVLPDINGIQSISCLSPWTMIKNEDGKSATFDIQISIEYIKRKGEL